jgi:hypothetical protein
MEGVEGAAGPTAGGKPPSTATEADAVDAAASTETSAAGESTPTEAETAGSEESTATDAETDGAETLTEASGRLSAVGACTSAATFTGPTSSETERPGFCASRSRCRSPASAGAA